MRGADATELTRCMMGSDPPRPTSHERADIRAVSHGEPVIRFDGVVVPASQGRAALYGVTLAVTAGEIVGVAGIDGNGQHALADAVAGLAAVSAGRIGLCGRDVTRVGVRERRALGFAYIPEDRHHTGLVLDLSIADNLRLHDFQRKPWRSAIGRLRRSAMREEARAAMARHDIRARTETQHARWLSGGNQQKIVLARELGGEKRAIVVAQPCKGLDVTSTRAVHDALHAQRRRGAGVLYISTELDHLLEHCDRIVVLAGGRIAGEVRCRTGADAGIPMRIGAMMAGTA